MQPSTVLPSIIQVEKEITFKFFMISSLIVSFAFETSKLDTIFNNLLMLVREW